ncbi:MAG TPA: ABC transporter C-terminal domain-containing protein, partial [Thermoanaerobaculia bacterium]|nr:ABC transporter C-terminal domain-containing protein [Thermoanaerobaculia bacterium]
NRRTPSSKRKESSPGAPRSKTKKLSYQEQREWEGMEQAVLEVEERLEQARQRTEDSAIATDPEALQKRFADLATVQDEADTLYARWAELEAKMQ